MMTSLGTLKARLDHWLHRERPAPPLKPSELLLFTVHLETMLRCGLQIVNALDILARGDELQPREAAARLASDVSQGMMLSRAMARQPESFPPSYYRVVEVGEATGQMAEVLGRLALTLNQQNRTRHLLRGALTYPLFLLGACGVMVTVMLYFVFPMVVKVTQDAGVQPPFLTRTLIYVTGWDKLVFLVVSSLLVGGGLAALLRQPRFGPPLRRFAEAWTPPGRFFAQTRVLASVRQLAVMMECGVDMLRALNGSFHVGEDSVLVREAFEDIVKRVRAGEMLSECFARHPVFPGTLAGMVSVSDSVGDTHRMLHRTADLIEENLNHQINTVTAAMEPILMGVMGVVVGTLLLAAFLPIYNLIVI